MGGSPPTTHTPIPYLCRACGVFPERRTNTPLVNRAYELAGFREALDYRDDPLIKALSRRGDEGGLNEHLRVLREQGWEAFRQSRGAMYRENQTRGP